MQNMCQWAILSILLWSPLTHASPPTFEWKDPNTDEKLLCEKCPPGMSMAKPCTRNVGTQCKPCANEHYTQYWNYVDRCLYCNVRCNILEVEVGSCNRTHNRVCECKPGYHAESLFCIKHSKCPSGSGVVEPGNAREDTQCRVCPQGTFSSNHSSSQPCQPHQNCSAQGLRVNVPGTRFHDTYCTSCRADKGWEEGSGIGDCHEAALDFVAFQLKSPRRLQRLYRKLTQTPPGTQKKKAIEELQVDLHSYLHQLKNLHGKERAWDMVQVALAKMKLEHILKNVQRSFSVGL
ncbi:tumor necrosis factor receptor superfamily member 6B-like [Notechis scutatus]|uniref:Tumor necrosis factor receptor superfamily member 6B-like n=1 Tax=Notechis scutatus TaxID=8663 RepID=A0A6J1VLK8_9SAUR|nr:tumor necrosis factor receptor superfamily member 6B-like [Notechis scutatus]